MRSLPLRVALVPALLVACAEDDTEDVPVPVEEAPLADDVLDGIDLERIRDGVELLAGEAMEGRVPSTPGHAAAGAWIEDQLADIGLAPLADGYVVEHDLTLDRELFGIDETGTVVSVPMRVTGRTYLGVLPGSDPALADEHIVLLAHYDHLGVDPDGTVYPGAFDNAVSVVGLLELARVLVEAGVSFPRSVLFFFSDAEETSLAGTEAWVADPTLSLDDLVLVMSVDPLGRGVLPDHAPLALLGAERAPGVRAGWEAVADHVETDLAFANRAPLLTNASDQDSFWDAGVPALWVASPGMAFYHSADDTPQTVDYRTVGPHLRAIAQATAWFASDDGTYVDQGPQPVSVADLADGVAFVEGALGSSELTDDERETLEGFRDRMQGAVDADAASPDAAATYVEALAWALFTLAPSHPGPIPPPWPE